MNSNSAGRDSSAHPPALCDLPVPPDRAVLPVASGLPVLPAPLLGFHGLDPCVHCGFCLPACPTYLATGDEADSPRGRIVLMRALERREIAADDPALVNHLERCIWCQGCESVCPSGVQYHEGIGEARAIIAAERKHRGGGLAMPVFGSKPLYSLVFTMGRLLRNLGLPSLWPRQAPLGRAMALLAASAPAAPIVGRTRKRTPSQPHRGTVVFFETCTMPTLFPHVQAAARRVLEANGYEVRAATGYQACCGAPLDHEGRRDEAKRMAQANLGLARDADYIVNTSAGCGAQLREYGDLLQTGAAVDFSARVRDVTELLAAAGPRPGGPLELDVAYDAPCHLQHAQRVHEQPLAVLRSIPGLRLQLVPGYDQCCGSGGLYSFTQPDLAAQVLDAKIQALAAASPRPAYVVTGNPGCLMQIGAGLRAARVPIGVAHPVELLDWSYGVESTHVN